jgi:hypothetical protein
MLGVKVQALGLVCMAALHDQQVQSGVGGLSTAHGQRNRLNFANLKSVAVGSETNVNRLGWGRAVILQDAVAVYGPL